MGFDINIFALVAAGVTSVVIGAVWYTPAVFGTAWMSLAGLTAERAETAKKRMPYMAVGGFLASVILAWVLAQFVSALNIIAFGDALIIGFWMWFGFMVPVLIGPVLWEQKSIKYFAINAGYWLVTILAIATIVTLWS